MSREETLRTRYGEMLDLIVCQGIYNGAMKQKQKRIFTFDEALSLE